MATKILLALIAAGLWAKCSRLFHSSRQSRTERVSVGELSDIVRDVHALAGIAEC